MVPGAKVKESDVYVIMLAVLMVTAIGASWRPTGLVRKYAIERSLLDVPSQRSSHANPTPRGGGLSIVLVVMLGVVILTSVHVLPQQFAVALLGGMVLVAAIGWIDDVRGVPPAARAVVHFLAAAWALHWLHGFTGMRIGPFEWHLGTTGTVLAAFVIVWLTNLYNFMDGIDGLAASEAVFVGMVGGVLLLLGGNAGLGSTALLVASASGGFLIWNWAPAKIFMGDVGSGALGYIFGVLAISSERSGGFPLVLWGLLLGVFLIDATTTLLRRVISGERWHKAHRRHTYQRVAQAGLSHAHVTIWVLGVNALLACLAVVGWTASKAVIPASALGLIILLGLYWRIERAYPMTMTQE